MKAPAPSAAAPSSSVFRRLWGYVAPHRGMFLLAMGQMLLLAGVELLKPWPLKLVVDCVLGGQRPPIAALGRLSPGTLLAVSCGAVVLLQAVYASVSFWSNHTTISIGQRMVNDLRSDLYQHLQRMSLAFHAHRQVGDLLFRVAADTFAVQSLTMNGFFPIVSATVFALGMVVVLAYMDPQLTLVAVAVCPLLFVTIRLLGRWISESARVARQEDSQVYTLLQHGLSAIRLVQAFTQEEEEHRRFVRQSQASLTANLRLYLLQTLYVGIVNVVTAAGTAMILWLGARRVLAGEMSVGDVLVFLSYLASLYVPVNSVSQSLGTIEGAKAGLVRVFEILDSGESVASGSRELRRADVIGELRFENVGFSYDGQRTVLSDVSFTVPPGGSVALVGPTGAGKTTIVSLIPRFFDPVVGRVLLDGRDLRELDLASLRRSISMVLQPPIVFAATMRENIAYGRPAASAEDIARAARLAQLDPLLDRLSLGLDTRIGEGGATLSEGERQRLTIARAIVRDAPILILDEPTASVDSETEELIMAALRALMKGRTTFLIAHRLSTVRQVDRILVVRDGRVVESGSYRELVDRRGFFARLVELQGSPSPREAVGS
ncbi:MAG: ATP-binding cassette, subfamily bacterial [Candidatus Binatota bacterium]|nr:ATP-binding cassette, subfamily bacterial [Candidatus Binatota bacterium]